MSARVVVRDEARSDVFQIAAHIADRDLAAGLRFLDAAEQTFGRLAEWPRSGTRRRSNNSALKHMRSLPLPGRFKNYVAFYLPLADGVEIVRVLHGARDVRRIFEEEDV